MLEGLRQQYLSAKDLVEADPKNLAGVLLVELSRFGQSFTEDHLMREAVEMYRSIEVSQAIVEAIQRLKAAGLVATSPTTRDALSLTRLGRTTASAGSSSGLLPSPDVITSPDWTDSLIAEARALTYNDDAALDRLVKKARMLIRKHLGKNATHYTDEIGPGSFHVMAFGQVNPRDDQVQWATAQQELVNTLEVLQQEVRISQTNTPSQAAPAANPMTPKNLQDVFLIHGHDEAMKQSVARVLEKLGLHPIILHEKPNLGKTIIDKFEHYGRDVGFAVAILSPDDLGREKNASVDKQRPRLNVIFELGYFIGRIGRERVVALVPELPEGEFEWPSDYQGVLYTVYDKKGRWELDLVRELRAAGYRVSADSL